VDAKLFLFYFNFFWSTILVSVLYWDFSLNLTWYWPVSRNSVIMCIQLLGGSSLWILWIAQRTRRWWGGVLIMGAERIVGQLVGLRIMMLGLLTGRPVGFCKHF
jgi:hypothetical protein